MFNNYCVCCLGCVTKMMIDLQLESLENSRQTNRLYAKTRLRASVDSEG